MEIYTQNFVEEANAALKAKKIPLQLYNTDKLHILRIKKTMENGQKRTLRNGNSGRIIQNRFAVFFIGQILGEM